MSERNDGGPAFPTTKNNQEYGGVFYGTVGMSLRDWFAGQAISATLQAFITRGEGPTSLDEVQHLVERAFQVADAMLKAREATP